MVKRLRYPKPRNLQTLHVANELLALKNDVDTAIAELQSQDPHSVLLPELLVLQKEIMSELNGNQSNDNYFPETPSTANDLGSEMISHAVDARDGKSVLPENGEDTTSNLKEEVATSSSTSEIPSTPSDVTRGHANMKKQHRGTPKDDNRNANSDGRTVEALEQGREKPPITNDEAKKNRGYSTVDDFARWFSSPEFSLQAQNTWFSNNKTDDSFLDADSTWFAKADSSFEGEGLIRPKAPGFMGNKIHIKEKAQEEVKHDGNTETEATGPVTKSDSPKHKLQAKADKPTKQNEAGVPEEGKVSESHDDTGCALELCSPMLEVEPCRAQIGGMSQTKVTRKYLKEVMNSKRDAESKPESKTGEKHKAKYDYTIEIFPLKSVEESLKRQGGKQEISWRAQDHEEVHRRK